MAKQITVVRMEFSMVEDLNGFCSILFYSDVPNSILMKKSQKLMLYGMSCFPPFPFFHRAAPIAILSVVLGSCLRRH